MKSVEIWQSRFSFLDNNWDNSTELFFRVNKKRTKMNVSLENKETNNTMGTKEDGREGGDVTWHWRVRERWEAKSHKLSSFAFGVWTHDVCTQNRRSKWVQKSGYKFCDKSRAAAGMEDCKSASHQTSYDEESANLI
jgi:hypothetical protein